MSYRALAVLLLLAAPAACKKANSAAGGGPGGAGVYAMPVEVSPAIRDTVVDAIAATGQIEAVQSIELRPEVQGRITDILVREGQDVAAGTALFKVDDAELKAQVAQAEAERQMARQALERTKQLIAQNASSTSDLEQAQAKSQGADANYDLLKTGMFIEARLATNIRPNAIVVPEDAILPLQGSTFVWMVKDGKADRRQVTLGVRTAGWAEILGGGIEAGDQVVVGGAERLFPNAPVMPQVVERHRGAPTAESTSTRSAGGGGAGDSAKH